MLAYSALAVHPWIVPPAGFVLAACWWLCPTSLIPDPVFLLCCQYQPSAQMHNLKWQSLSGSKWDCMCTENINTKRKFSLLHQSNRCVPYLFIHWHTCHLMARLLYAKISLLLAIFKYFSKSTVYNSFLNILRKSCTIQIIVLLQLLSYLHFEKG